MEGVERANTEVKYRWLVVANDATEEVRADPRISVDFSNDNPDEFYINRVYRAWNEGVIQAPTQLVCMLNSDMYVSDGWLDALMNEKDWHQEVPTSLLVESGRVPSGMPDYVRDFGMTPDTFDREGFLDHAGKVRNRELVSEGQLYMPILVDRQEFMDVGGYPEGNPPGTTGDKDLIRRYKEAGLPHVTCHGSVVYHAVMGEQKWP